MRILALPLLVVSIGLLAAPDLRARQTGLDRLPPDILDVVPPSAHVRGRPGTMAVDAQACRVLPTAETRRRVVDVAVQEWAFFGFRIVDETVVEDDDDNGRRRGRRGGSRLGAAEAARVAASIAGYWAVTPEGSWIVERQNDVWRGPWGDGADWDAPWSAAFISWVMCAAGLGEHDQFRRAVAHHAYIDQAIRARDGRAPEAAFVAHDAGEEPIAPGDLLCSSRRPLYRSIAERRRQMGDGARSHCDVVVKVDEATARILAIGGNVRDSVSLKIFPGVRESGRPMRVGRFGDGDRPMFAHLKLRAAPIAANALDSSPTITTAGCTLGSLTPRLVAALVPPPPTPALRC